MKKINKEIKFNIKIDLKKKTNKENARCSVQLFLDDGEKNPDYYRISYFYLQL
jgi:hypothetical protein